MECCEQINSLSLFAGALFMILRFDFIWILQPAKAAYHVDHAACYTAYAAMPKRFYESKCAGSKAC